MLFLRFPSAVARRAAVGGARVRALDLRRHASTSARLSTIPTPRDIYGVDHNDMVRVVPQRVVPLALEVGNLPTPFLQYKCARLQLRLQ